MLAHWKQSYDQPRQHIQKQRPYFSDKGLFSQSYGFSSSEVQIYSDVSWTIKKIEHQRICFRTVVLEKTLKSLGQQGDETSQS